MITKRKRNWLIGITVLVGLIVEALVALYTSRSTGDSMSNEEIALFGMAVGLVAVLCALIINYILNMSLRESPTERKPLS